MGLINFSELLAYIQTILHLVQRGLRLDPEAFRLVYQYTGQTYGIMFWIVFIAGISMLLGQSITLIANRVSTGRFWLGILLGGLKFVLEALIVAVSVWIVANLFNLQSLTFSGIARAVALAFAPYWLGFLLFMPYLGIGLERFIKAYVFVALTVALKAVFSLSFIAALVTAFLSVMLTYLLMTLLSRWLTPVAHRIDRAIFGDKQIKHSQEILYLFIQHNPTLTNTKEG